MSLDFVLDNLSIKYIDNTFISHLIDLVNIHGVDTVSCKQFSNGNYHISFSPSANRILSVTIYQNEVVWHYFKNVNENFDSELARAYSGKCSINDNVPEKLAEHIRMFSAEETTSEDE